MIGIPCLKSYKTEALADQVEKHIIAAWKLPPKSVGLKVTLCYTLAKSGSVSFGRVEKSSGNQSFI